MLVSRASRQQIRRWIARPPAGPLRSAVDLSAPVPATEEPKPRAELLREVRGSDPVATVSGSRVSLFPHLDACCESRSTCCNFLPVAQSMPIAPKLELNTTQKKYAQPCA